MSAFDRLHPSLQHHIVNSLGWRSLRLLQEQAIEPLLEGQSCLLIAPTAGGKTEAAFFPLLSRMLAEHWDGFSLLYVCPIRALLNNLEQRLALYCSLVGRRCGLWHGDVGQAMKAGILSEPPDVLLTTPESLEAMLISRRTDRPFFFGRLQAVVIDEIHSFAGDDRGWHLLAVLERVGVLAGRNFQRVGLSATVGNPEQLLGWMQGSSRRPAKVLMPPVSDLAAADVQLDYVGSVENAGIIIRQLHHGQKRLVFCDSRSQAERLAATLRAAGVATFVSHSSLSADERRQAERAFREARDCVIVATSTLELGIDVGDLDRVIQLDAPSTVSSFLQRLGRTGRRPGSQRNCLFLATQRESLVRAAALIHLWKGGFVEPLEPPPLPYQLFAQQIMALILQEGGLRRSGWTSWVGRLPVFRGEFAGAAEEVLARMLATGILFEDGGVLGIGPAGEREFGAKHFMMLTSIFDTPPLFRVTCGLEELGWVHPVSFVGYGDRPVVLCLGGRSWEVVHIDNERNTASVRATDMPGRSRWLGESRPLGFDLCRAVRSLLAGKDQALEWSRRAVGEIALCREECQVADSQKTVAIEGDEQTVWWTFAGARANAWLVAALGYATGRQPEFDNYALRFSGRIRLAEFEEQLTRLPHAGGRNGSPPIPTDATRIKFWSCIPDGLRPEFTQRRFTDAVTAHAVLSEPRLFRDSQS